VGSGNHSHNLFPAVAQHSAQRLPNDAGPDNGNIPAMLSDGTSRDLIAAEV